MHLSRLAVSLVVALVLVACGDGEGVPSTTTTIVATTTTSPTTTAPEPSTTTTVPVALPIADPGDPRLEVLFSLPADGTGVTYTGDPDVTDFPVTGPQAISVAPDGSIWIADTEALRLIKVDQSGALLLDIDTDAQLVGPVIDLAAYEGGVYALEAVPAFGRYRIISYSTDGELLADFELPERLHLENGLTGIEADARGAVWVEIESGRRVFAAFGAGGEYDPTEVDGYEVADTLLHVVVGGGGVVRYAVGDAVVEFPVRDTGSVALQGSAPGVVALQVSDVAFEEVLVVDVYVAIVGLNGELLAEAVYPLDDVDEVYVPQDFVAIAPDGRVIALVPRDDGVEVVALTLYAPGTLIG